MVYGRKLAQHVHLGLLHLHPNTHDMLVSSWGVFCFVHTLVSV